MSTPSKGYPIVKAMKWLFLVTLAGCGVPTPTKVEFRAAPAGDVVAGVAREYQTATKERRPLLVYVGASWCEPCQRFHRAVAEGKLDASFPGLRLLEFDLDRDRERLAAAGYASRLIPLLAQPGPDGRATGKQMEGSIKGDGAVAQMVPRLAELLRK
jgi:hypothetical protein